MTKKQKEQAEAVSLLKEWGLKDNTTVYAKVAKVSASGMYRREWMRHGYALSYRL